MRYQLSTKIDSVNVPQSILPVSNALEILSVSVIMAWVVLCLYLKPD